MLIVWGSFKKGDTNVSMEIFVHNINDLLDKYASFKKSVNICSNSRLKRDNCSPSKITFY